VASNKSVQPFASEADGPANAGLGEFNRGGVHTPPGESPLGSVHDVPQTLLRVAEQLGGFGQREHFVGSSGCRRQGGEAFGDERLGLARCGDPPETACLRDDLGEAKPCSAVAGLVNDGEALGPRHLLTITRSVSEGDGPVEETVEELLVAVHFSRVDSCLGEVKQ